MSIVSRCALEWAAVCARGARYLNLFLTLSFERRGPESSRDGMGGANARIEQFGVLREAV